ncbi:MAG TPA: HAMP domain-containing sensor histidine kinase [Bryobacteraceae bacterium]|nr:HAMP domain-containing sensor histidine kinase [Bryobacteraceae bacterium]
MATVDNMWRERAGKYLLPGDIERDERFRAGIRRLGHIGLQVTGSTQVVVSAFMVTAQILLDPDPELTRLRLITGVLMISLGLLMLAAAKVRRLYPFARKIAGGGAVLSAGVLITMMLLMTQYDPTASDFIPGHVTLVVLVSVAALPLRPTDTLLLGFMITAEYIVAALAAQELFTIGVGVERFYVLFMVMITCLAAALSGVLYDQRRAAYEWSQRLLASAERLRQTEARNLLAENAASVGRLAAALSHELNSPIGALVSGVDTLLLLTSRQAAGDHDAQARTVMLQNDVRKSIRQSTERLKEIVQRMQRFTNLDKAEVQSACVNNLITDTAALVTPRYEGRIQVELDLKPLVNITCRPQQLSAVFANLLGNACDAAADGTIVRVSSSLMDDTIIVRFEDEGRGLDPDQLTHLFDPEFKVTDGRVSTGNWSMFSSRQMIRDHGGDIAIASRRGEGTTVTVSLPVKHPAQVSMAGSGESRQALH